MNDRELDKILKSASLPEQPAEFWKQLLTRITAKIHWQSREPSGTGLIYWIGRSVRVWFQRCVS